MSEFVWCKREERRIPAFKCLLCRDDCYARRDREGGAGNALGILLKSGRYKECYVMKRKESVESAENSLRQSTDTESGSAAGTSPASSTTETLENVYVMDEGKLTPFAPEDYTVSNLYQVLDSFSVECKLVRPEDPSNIVFEGKKPSRKTVPVLVTKEGESLVLDSWEALDARPELLATAVEVMGVTPVKKVFVLRRK
jgi:hypothetical protein